MGHKLLSYLSYKLSKVSLQYTGNCDSWVTNEKGKIQMIFEGTIEREKDLQSTLADPRIHCLTMVYETSEGGRGHKKISYLKMNSERYECVTWQKLFR